MRCKPPIPMALARTHVCVHSQTARCVTTFQRQRQHQNQISPDTLSSRDLCALTSGSSPFVGMAQGPQLLKQCLKSHPLFHQGCRALATSASNAEITTGSIKQLQADLRSGARSAVEVTKDYLERVAKTEPSIKSFLHVAEESALEQAAAVDRAIEGGEALGPLAGVPIGVKVSLL